MTSPDGITWTIRTSAADNWWVSVTYGNGLFVAVSMTGGNNSVMTSPDGFTWTSRTAAAANEWRSVTYANGLFVAVATNGTGNRVMTSADAFAPGNPTINSITPRDTYATVAFTAPASSGFSAITGYQHSLDNGNNWVIPSPALTSSPYRISGLTSGTTYDIQLRAVSSTGSGCGSSTVNTTTLVPTVPDAPTSVVATAGVNAAYIAFTAPANDGGSDITDYEYTIDNGVTWIAIASTISPLYIVNLTACTDYSIKLRAVNSAGDGTASAAVTITPQNGLQTGISWTNRSAAADNQWRSVTYGNGLFVAVATSGTGNRVMTSPDGITWTSRTSAANLNWRSITYGNGLFVAVSSDGVQANIMTSPDGISWTLSINPLYSGCTSVTFGNGLFVAVAETGTGNRVKTSPDGITWTIRTSAADNQWQSVTYGNGLFVAVAQSGTGNRVMTSPDGITWTLRTSAADNGWTSVTYGNGLFVAVALTGTGNRVMTSPDGITWTERTAAVVNNWTSVAYGNGLFVAMAGIGTQFMTSPNGITWTQRTRPTINNIYGVTYGNGLFVSVASGPGIPLVMTSSDALAPDIPTINTITPSVTSASLAFTPPANAGASAISNYEYSIDDGSNWITRSPSSITSPLTITGLTAGTTYPVKLRAVNSSGASCGSTTMNVTTSAAALPVVWHDFKAVFQNEAVLLTWQTASEQHTKDFLVQHSTGTGWIEIGKVTAAGNSSQLTTYTFRHSNPSTGKNVYRLLQRDLDEKEAFSKIVWVNVDRLSNGFVVYPTLVSSGTVNIRLPEAENITIYDAHGRLVLDKIGIKGAQTLSVSHLAKGQYFIKAGKQTSKFILQ